MPVLERVNRHVFDLVHRNNLVYNTCWEDPRLDRAALSLTGDDTVLAITSAGCNVLDYVLTEPAHVYAVDVNPRQNALLELKIAAIRRLDFEQFFAMFGRGYLEDAQGVYRAHLRAELSPWARRYWDCRIGFFANGGSSFFFRGTAGRLARALNLYIDRVIGARRHVDAILAASSVDEQRAIYRGKLRDRFWSPPVRLALGRDVVLSMIGVPAAQRRQVDAQYGGGIVQFMQDRTDAVFTRIPLRDNYFWRVYLSGRYTRECCPEYLKAANFARLQAGLADRISIHTISIAGFLRRFSGNISRFVLLDHMDWLADRHQPSLAAEWQAIVDHAAPGARALWRSGGLQTDFLDDVTVRVGRTLYRLHEVLTYRSRLAAELHACDRVHTYGSFYIADIMASSA